METIQSDMQVLADSEQKNKMQSDRYNKFVACISPKTSLTKSLLHSFVFGGAICVLGQVLFECFLMIPNMTQKTAMTAMLMSLIFLSILLTGIGIYDNLARVGGAGCFLPITGFANAMASASIEFKTEGLVFGTSVKMFSIVGPVIVNGVVWSSVAAILHYVITMII
ncbi:MAG: SpoVA/SpoVAEb family sporulation membrane protein [Firmicutes bacterium]|nr:SpoVA/SpoVAEb family sporulation membrane protein [Bacillota bacterium]